MAKRFGHNQRKKMREELEAVEIFESLSDIEATTTGYRRNSSTMDSISSTLALQSLERRRDELRLALEAVSERSLNA